MFVCFSICSHVSHFGHYYLVSPTSCCNHCFAYVRGHISQDRVELLYDLKLHLSPLKDADGRDAPNFSATGKYLMLNWISLVLWFKLDRVDLCDSEKIKLKYYGVLTYTKPANFKSFYECNLESFLRDNKQLIRKL